MRIALTLCCCLLAVFAPAIPAWANPVGGTGHGGEGEAMSGEVISDAVSGIAALALALISVMVAIIVFAFNKYDEPLGRYLPSARNATKLFVAAVTLAVFLTGLHDLLRWLWLAHAVRWLVGAVGAAFAWFVVANLDHMHDTRKRDRGEARLQEMPAHAVRTESTQ
jgi:hypothetical protein